MAGISASVEIVDRVSGALNRITASLYSTTSAFDSVDRASDRAFNNTAGVQAITQEIYTYEQRVQQLEADLIDANDRLQKMEEQNYKVAQSANMMGSVYRGIVGIMSTIGGIQVLNKSDELVQTTARIGMMNDGLQSTQELVQMVYGAAQDARGGFIEMADVVARFGNNAGDAFGSSAEVVAFANLVQKQMTIAGASTEESSNAILQLSQALGSGVLRGDELNSIFEQAPNLIQSIADYLEVPLGEIREMASEGEITADIVKNAIFASADEINEKFEEMPMTWAQIWQMMQNTALMKFQPVLQRLNDIANSSGFQRLVDGATTGMAVVANAAITIFDTVGAVGTFMADNWSVISPIIYGVVTALTLYAGYLAVVKAAELIGTVVKIAMCFASYAHAAATRGEASATAAATAKQYSLNTALLSCPLTWIVIAIIALIAVIISLCSWIAKATGVANSWFGVLMGGIFVIWDFFKNLGLSIANIALGIWYALGACAENTATAFHNAISSIQSWFYNLLYTALTVVAGICGALNNLPFIEFDYSGITAKADEYAAKSAEIAVNKEEYTSIGNAFDEGMSTFDTFQDGWVSNAFSAGAAWGDGVSDKISSGLDGLLEMFNEKSEEDESWYTEDYSEYMANDLSSIAGDTAAISDAIDISNENLKYLRDVAERDVINRFTTAEIKVDMQNNNTISNGMDIDGVVEELKIGVQEAMEQAAEGVHE